MGSASVRRPSFMVSGSRLMVPLKSSQVTPQSAVSAGSEPYVELGKGGPLNRGGKCDMLMMMFNVDSNVR